MSDLPEVVEELAGACVRAVHQAVGVELDFTQDTLPVLDHYLTQADTESEEVMALLSPISGAYFGEVIRRSLGMDWHVPSDDYGEWRLEHRRCFLWFNPVGAAIEALSDKEAEGWDAHLHMLERDTPAVKAALEGLGDVRAKDFYRLAVRYEVLQTAVESMMRAATQRGEPAIFGADVYAAAVGASEEIDS